MADKYLCVFEIKIDRPEVEVITAGWPWVMGSTDDQTCSFEYPARPVVMLSLHPGAAGSAKVTKSEPRSGVSLHEMMRWTKDDSGCRKTWNEILGCCEEMDGERRCRSKQEIRKGEDALSKLEAKYAQLARQKNCYATEDAAVEDERWTWGGKIHQEEEEKICQTIVYIEVFAHPLASFERKIRATSSLGVDLHESEPFKQNYASTMEQSALRLEWECPVQLITGIERSSDKHSWR